MSEEYIMINRLIVVLQIIAIPVYFLTLTNFLPYLSIPVINDSAPWLNLLLIRLIVPLVLSLPLVGATYIRRYQTADAYDQMGNRIWRLPTGIKAFYGLNFFLIVVFGLPLVAPLIGLLGGYYLGLIIFGRSTDPDKPNISRPNIRASLLLYLPFALCIAIIFYAQAWNFYTDIYTLWTNNVDLMYSSALNLANAVVFGSLILIIFEYRQLQDYSLNIPPVAPIITGSIFFLLELPLLVFNFMHPGVLTAQEQLGFNIVNLAAFVSGLVILVLRWRFALDQDQTQEGNSFWAWITILLFQIVNFITSVPAPGGVHLLTRTTAIFLASIIFIVLFILSYRNASKNY